MKGGGVEKEVENHLVKLLIRQYSFSTLVDKWHSTLLGNAESVQIQFSVISTQATTISPRRACGSPMTTTTEIPGC